MNARQQRENHPNCGENGINLRIYARTTGVMLAFPRPQQSSRETRREERGPRIRKRNQTWPLAQSRCRRFRRRLQFEARLLENPSNFGNLKASAFEAVAPLTGSVFHCAE